MYFASFHVNKGHKSDSVNVKASLALPLKTTYYHTYPEQIVLILRLHINFISIEVPMKCEGLTEDFRLYCSIFITGGNQGFRAYYHPS